MCGAANGAANTPRHMTQVTMSGARSKQKRLSGSLTIGVDPFLYSGPYSSAVLSAVFLLRLPCPGLKSRELFRDPEQFTEQITLGDQNVT